MRDVLYYPRRAAIDAGRLSDQEHRDFAEALVYFCNMVIEMRNLAAHLSRGDLDIKLPNSDNEIAAPLKALHSTLKHLTWQASQVAQGDYKQEVRFMGEFSAAFNDMTAQLAERNDQMEAEVDLEKKRAQELAKANSIFEVITSNMEEWIVMIDSNTGEYLFANHKAKEALASDISGQQLYDVLAQCAASIPEDEPQKQFFSLTGADTPRHFELMVYHIKWFAHDAVACVITDVTATKEEYNRISNAAYRDTMTGAFNRNYGMEMLGQWAEAHTEYILVFIDMDMLKYVNDVFGHGEGDAYIKSVSDILHEISPAASVSRLGGDEFMVLLKKHDAPEMDMADILEKLREKLIASSASNERGKAGYLRSMSYGIVEVGSDNESTISDILALADDRMYEYKKAHKKERRV